VAFQSDRNGTWPQPDLHLQGGRVENAALEMMGPPPERVDLMMGNQLIELIDPQEKSADRARVSLRVVLGDPTDQTMAVASERQKRCPERGVFRVKRYFRDAPRPARYASPDRVRCQPDHSVRLTL
jgi:hypothetical protein